MTTLGRFRRQMLFVLYKSRPYRETTFVERVSATTTDEIQISTAASVLRRVHDDAPNSRYREVIQQSVWQVAGSPAYRMPPSLNLPDWIVDQEMSDEYFSRLPPYVVVALLVAWLRDRPASFMGQIRTLSNVLERVNNPELPCALLATAIRGIAPSILTSMIRMGELKREDTIWGLYPSSRNSARWKPIPICISFYCTYQAHKTAMPCPTHMEGPTLEPR